MEEIITILAVIAGWLLSELTLQFRSSRSKKEAISIALSVLLAVRFKLVCLEKVIDLLKTNGAPEDVVPVLRNIFDTIIPESDKLHDSYEDSIALLAKTSPVLAHEFRSKNSILMFLSTWRSMACEHGISGQELEKYELKLKSAILPEYNRILVELAKKHSRSTLKEIEQVISNELELPDELMGILDFGKG